MTKWKWFVYILECLDESYYTGITWDIVNRYEGHQLKTTSKYTAKHGVKKLSYIEEHDNFEEARAREKQIKGWSRQKKQKLIKGEWSKIY